MEDRQETVGARVRRLRLERGLSQADLAQKGMSLSYVSYVERDQRTPSVKALRLLAQRLGVSAGYLETGESGRGDAKMLEAELSLRLGDVAFAEQAFASELEQARRRGSETSAARALVGLAMVAQSREAYAAAIDLFEQALAVARPDAAERPDLYDALARCYGMIGEPVRAVMLLRQCLEEVRDRAPVNPVAVVRFGTLLSYALSDLGDTGGSHAAIVETLRHAEGLEDMYSLVRINWSLGRSYSLQGQANQAAVHFERAIGLLEQTEDRYHLALAHESYATIMLDDGRPDEARPHLELAERLLSELGESTALGHVSVEWARYHLLTDEVEVAKRAAVKAMTRLRDAPGGQGDAGAAWLALAGVHVRLGELDLGEASYQAAIEALSQRGQPRALAEAHRAYADLLAAVGRTEEALAAMRAATEFVGIRGIDRVEAETAGTTPGDVQRRVPI